MLFLCAPWMYTFCFTLHKVHHVLSTSPSLHPDQQDRAAKCVIPLTHLNVLMNGPGLESHPNSMLLAFWDEKLKKTRHVFVYAELAKVRLYEVTCGCQRKHESSPSLLNQWLQCLCMDNFVDTL